MSTFASNLVTGCAGLKMCQTRNLFSCTNKLRYDSLVWVTAVT